MFRICVLLQFKAAIRTFNPREEKYMQPEPKFKISVSSSLAYNMIKQDQEPPIVICFIR